MQKVVEEGQCRLRLRVRDHVPGHSDRQEREVVLRVAGHVVIRRIAEREVSLARVAAIARERSVVACLYHVEIKKYGCRCCP